MNIRYALPCLLALACGAGCATSSNHSADLRLEPRIQLPPTPEFAPTERRPLANQAVRSLAVIVCMNSGGQARFASGFHVAHGLVLTSAHMIEGGYTNFAIAFTGDSEPRPCRLGLIDEPADMMLLEIDPNHRGNLPPILPVRNTAPRWAEDILVLGFPRRPLLQFIPSELRRLATPVVTHGIVSGVNVEIGDPVTSYVQVDAGAAPGNSGGPVLGMDGKVIAVIKGFSEADPHQVFAIPNARIWASFGRVIAARR
jgi:S1-C subfamily serine protease